MAGTVWHRIFAEWGLGGWPEGESKKNWNRLAASLNADHIETPLLMNAPDSEFLGSMALFTSLENLHKPGELYIYPNELHIKNQPRHRYEIYERNVDWFRFWLEGEKDSSPEENDQYSRWETLRKTGHKARRTACRTSESLPSHRRWLECTEAHPSDVRATRRMSRLLPPYASAAVRDRNRLHKRVRGNAGHGIRQAYDLRLFVFHGYHLLPIGFSSAEKSGGGIAEPAPRQPRLFQMEFWENCPPNSRDGKAMLQGARFLASVRSAILHLRRLRPTIVEKLPRPQCPHGSNLMFLVRSSSDGNSLRRETSGARAMNAFRRRLRISDGTIPEKSAAHQGSPLIRPDELFSRDSIKIFEKIPVQIRITAFDWQSGAKAHTGNLSSQAFESG